MKQEKVIPPSLTRPVCIPPESPLVTDPNGSYTGPPLDRAEIPVQDAADP